MNDTEEIMNTLAEAIQTGLQMTVGPKGFCLLIFDFNTPGISNYVSNSNREDMVKALRETADRIENKEDIPPAIGNA